VIDLKAVRTAPEEMRAALARKGAGELFDELLEVGIPPRLGRHLGDVEEVVEVAVHVEAGRNHRVHRLPRLRQGDGDVNEPLACRRIGDDRALVADDEIVEPRLLEVRPHRPEHAARHDDDVSAGRARPLERGLCPGTQRAVLGDERPVEIEGEGGDGPRKARRKLDRYGAVPPVEVTT
jgi:hypothetical protein